MARRRNEIEVKWSESKDEGMIHRVNVKHILGDLAQTKQEDEIVVKLGSHRYRATVVDMLDWQPPKKNIPRNAGVIQNSKKKNPTALKTKASIRCAKIHNSRRTGVKIAASKPLWLGSGSPAKSFGKMPEEAEVRAEDVQSRMALTEITNTLNNQHVTDHLSPSFTPPPSSPISPLLFSSPHTPSHLPLHASNSPPSPLSLHSSLSPCRQTQFSSHPPASTPYTSCIHPPAPILYPSHVHPSTPTHYPSHVQPPTPTHCPSGAHPPAPTHYPSHVHPSTPTHYPSHVQPPTPTHCPSGAHPPAPTHYPSHVHPPGPTHCPSGAHLPAPTCYPSHVHPPAPTHYPSHVHPPAPTPYPLYAHTPVPTHYPSPTHIHLPAPTLYPSYVCPPAPTPYPPVQPQYLPYSPCVPPPCTTYPPRPSVYSCPPSIPHTPQYLSSTLNPSHQRSSSTQHADVTQCDDANEQFDLDKVFQNYADSVSPLLFKEEVISEAYKTANSQVNLAVQLAKRSYSRKERARSNCAGKCNKRPLSPRRLAAIKEAIYAIYPVRPGQKEEDVWRPYRLAIDSSCRQLNRATFNVT